MSHNDRAVIARRDPGLRQKRLALQLGLVGLAVLDDGRRQGEVGLAVVDRHRPCLLYTSRCV